MSLLDTLVGLTHPPWDCLPQRIARPIWVSFLQLLFGLCLTYLPEVTTLVNPFTGDKENQLPGNNPPKEENGGGFRAIFSVLKKHRIFLMLRAGYIWISLLAAWIATYCLPKGFIRYNCQSWTTVETHQNFLLYFQSGGLSDIFFQIFARTGACSESFLSDSKLPVCEGLFDFLLYCLTFPIIASNAQLNQSLPLMFPLGIILVYSMVAVSRATYHFLPPLKNDACIRKFFEWHTSARQYFFVVIGTTFFVYPTIIFAAIRILYFPKLLKPSVSGMKAERSWPVLVNQVVSSSSESWHILEISESLLVARGLTSNLTNIITWEDLRAGVGVWPSDQDRTFGIVHGFFLLFLGLVGFLGYMSGIILQYRNTPLEERTIRNFPSIMIASFTQYRFCKLCVIFAPVLVFYSGRALSGDSLLTVEGEIPISYSNLKLFEFDSSRWLHNNAGYLQFLW